MKPGSIIPSSASSLTSLTVTMTVMSYLACLAIGALILVDRAVTNWTSSLAREMTVQLRIVRDTDINQQLEKAQTVLSQFPGVLQSEVLDEVESARLLEPWLGTRSLEGLPVPRLIRIITDTENPPDVDVLEAEISKIKGARLDTHRKWETELTRMARALMVLSYSILVLISASAIAIVIFATRAVLQANRHIVDLLHLIGARDSYVARQIDGRFLRTGMIAGFFGVGLGLLTFLLLGLFGGGSESGVAAASRSLLFSTPESALWTYGFLFLVPVTATLISLVTARVTLLRRLGVVT
ncbi:cell division protein FtsX [Aestuariivirga sp.]|jgi:cell division transport system permease protein|uniref:cell division protein FtsX n=1 Tax=Aestuariivirga sp. TaxID=2650926 RepID=UPI0037847FD7